MQVEAGENDISRTHVRDLSASRGRGPAPTNIDIQSQHSSNTRVPRSQSSFGPAQSHTGTNAGLDRRPSASHSHFRQASRAQGSNYHQSRNPILLSSPTISPLSPDMLGLVDVDPKLPDILSLTTIRRGTSLRNQSGSSSMTSDKMSTNTSIAPSREDRDHVDGNESSIGQKVSDRVHTSKIRRGHSHHHSQSKHLQEPRHAQEQKSVGEYALHHLFNQVSSISTYRIPLLKSLKFLVLAEQKIERCMNSFADSRTLDSICGAGSDPSLDQLISSLVHTNRQKPKSLIDTMMLWRKAKHEEIIQAKKILDSVSTMYSTVLKQLTSERQDHQVQCRELIQDETQELHNSHIKLEASLNPLLTILTTQHQTVRKNRHIRPSNALQYQYFFSAES